MSRKIVYQTNHNGLYVGTVEAEESPLDPGVFLIPGGCVEVPPPVEIPEFKVARWDRKQWQLVDYFDGLIVYHTVTQSPRTLIGIDPIPNGYTLMKPEPGQVWKRGRWVDDLDMMLAKLHQQKLDMIKSSCARHIESGFDSDALGDRYRYDSALVDQVNLAGLIQSKFDALCACYGTDNEKVYREHTAAQLQNVGRHLVKHKQAALVLGERLKKVLTQTFIDKDLPAMNAIEWSIQA